MKLFGRANKKKIEVDSQPEENTKSSEPSKKFGLFNTQTDTSQAGTESYTETGQNNIEEQVHEPERAEPISDFSDLTGPTPGEDNSLFSNVVLTTDEEALYRKEKSEESGLEGSILETEAETSTQTKPEPSYVFDLTQGESSSFSEKDTTQVEEVPETDESEGTLGLFNAQAEWLSEETGKFETEETINEPEPAALETAIEEVGKEPDILVSQEEYTEDVNEPVNALEEDQQKPESIPEPEEAKKTGGILGIFSKLIKKPPKKEEVQETLSREPEPVQEEQVESALEPEEKEFADGVLGVFSTLPQESEESEMSGESETIQETPSEVTPSAESPESEEPELTSGMLGLFEELSQEPEAETLVENTSNLEEFPELKESSGEELEATPGIPDIFNTLPEEPETEEQSETIQEVSAESTPGLEGLAESEESPEAEESETTPGIPGIFNTLPEEPERETIQEAPAEITPDIEAEHLEVKESQEAEETEASPESLEILDASQPELETEPQNGTEIIQEAPVESIQKEDQELETEEAESTQGILGIFNSLLHKSPEEEIQEPLSEPETSRESPLIVEESDGTLDFTRPEEITETSSFKVEFKEADHTFSEQEQKPTPETDEPGEANLSPKSFTIPISFKAEDLPDETTEALSETEVERLNENPIEATSRQEIQRFGLEVIEPAQKRTLSIEEKLKDIIRAPESEPAVTFAEDTDENENQIDGLIGLFSDVQEPFKTEENESAEEEVNTVLSKQAEEKEPFGGEALSAAEKSQMEGESAAQEEEGYVGIFGTIARNKAQEAAEAEKTYQNPEDILVLQNRQSLLDALDYHPEDELGTFGIEQEPEESEPPVLEKVDAVQKLVSKEPELTEAEKTEEPEGFIGLFNTKPKIQKETPSPEAEEQNEVPEVQQTQPEYDGFLGVFGETPEDLTEEISGEESAETPLQELDGILGIFDRERPKRAETESVEPLIIDLADFKPEREEPEKKVEIGREIRPSIHSAEKLPDLFESLAKEAQEEAREAEQAEMNAVIEPLRPVAPIEPEPKVPRPVNNLDNTEEKRSYPDYEFATRDIPLLRDIIPPKEETELLTVTPQPETTQHNQTPNEPAWNTLTNEMPQAQERIPNEPKQVLPRSEHYYDLLNELEEGAYRPERQKNQQNTQQSSYSNEVNASGFYQEETVIEQKPENLSGRIETPLKQEQAEEREVPSVNLQINRVSQESFSQQVSGPEPRRPHNNRHRPNKMPMLNHGRPSKPAPTETIDISVTSVADMNRKAQWQQQNEPGISQDTRPYTFSETYQSSNQQAYYEQRQTGPAGQTDFSSFTSTSTLEAEAVAARRNKETKRQLRRQEHLQQEQIRSQTREMTQNLKPVAQAQKDLIFASVPDNILLGGITLFNNLAKQMQNSGALRVESLMSVLGAVAGYSTQEAAREKMVRRMHLSEDQVFSIVETKNGEKYYFGDAIDRTLQKDQHSIWYMTASATMRLTGKVDSNIDEIRRYTTRNLGKSTFGIPRLNKNIRPSHLPKYYVEHMWAALRPGLERFSEDPLEWPLIFSVALQRALICTRGILDPNTSLRIILESAVPMSVAEIHPIEPNSSRSEKEVQRKLIDKLRSEIDLLRNALGTMQLEHEQRELMLEELSLKTELLYKLLSENPGIQAP